MPVLDWLESTALAVWLAESPSVWALPAVLTLHTTGMAVLVGASWVLDLRLLGISRNIPLSAFRWVFPAFAIGLIVNLATGVLLFVKNATTLGTAVPFLVKMSLVVAGVATVIPIRRYVLNSDSGDGTIGGFPAEAPGGTRGLPAYAPRPTSGVHADASPAMPRVPADAPRAISSPPAEAAGPSAGRARVLAIASILAWCGAVGAGRLLAYLIP